jgi:UDP-N-acetylglucosamine 1-carboxyvinyltransferase
MVEPPYEMMRKMRASYYLVGAMLGRTGWARVGMPGGCDFGDRPIDQHIKGFEAMGAKVDVKNGVIHASAENGIKSGHIYFDRKTVGATINIMIAAARAPGMSVIENASKEPHIVDTANFLNSMGADIRGAGTDVIKVRGVPKLHGGTYSIIPDQIEAGTFIAAAAAAGGDITINNIIPKHLECITTKFAEMGVDIEEGDEYLRVKRFGELYRTNINALPYPGFPTDMQPQIVSVLCRATGTSIIIDGVYDNRFRYVDELRRMGAKIQVDGKVAVIDSVDELTGAPVCACDLRAGVALIIAGLSAKGRTEIDGVVHIERGYEDIVSKLKSLGADIDVKYADDLETVRKAL